MSELSRLLGTAGPPHQIENGGKTYSFRLIDQPTKNQLEKRLYQQAREEVYLDGEFRTAEEKQKELEQVRQRYDDGEFSFYSERMQKFILTIRGMKALLEVITGETEDELIPLLVARPEEVKTVLKTVMEESFKKLKPKQVEGATGG